MTYNQTTIAVPRIGDGVYTVPDASRILNLPLPRVQRWVSGYTRLIENGVRKHKQGIVDEGIWGSGRDRGLNFFALIEVFTFATLRDLGVSSQEIRKARAELASRFGTQYPFASHRLLSDGQQILVMLGTLEKSVLMILGEDGQTALREVVEPFCRKIDFCDATSLAVRFWPLGRDRAVVVDPHHSFGRPTIAETNIPTETITQFIRAGESIKVVAQEFDIPESSVLDAVKFEQQVAA